MSDTFALELSAEASSERIDDVVSFVGADASGSFGILANHEPVATVLRYGLCSYRVRGADRAYLALPGGALYFARDRLRIATRRYVCAADAEAVLHRLDELMRTEAESTRVMHEVLRDLDRELLRRLLAAR